MEITFFVGFGLILLYTILTIEEFGVPDSLSISHYHWKAVKEEYGHLFTFALWAFAFGNIVVMIELSGENTQWLAFISCAALCFVGAASEYLDSDVKTTHFVSAYVWAVSSLLWSIFVANTIVPIFIGLALGLTAIIFDKGRHATFWLEFACAIALAGSITMLLV